MTLTQAINKFGLHFAIALTSRGADDLAMDEIAAALERARDRTKNLPKPTEEERKQALEKARTAGGIRLVGGTH